MIKVLEKTFLSHKGSAKSLTYIRAFPSLLQGVEEIFQMVSCGDYIKTFDENPKSIFSVSTFSLYEESHEL